VSVEATNKKFELSQPLHPALARAHRILEPMFIEDILPESGHGLLATSDQWEKLLGTLPPCASAISDALCTRWGGGGAGGMLRPDERWEEVKRYLAVLSGKSSGGAEGAGGGKKRAKKLSAEDQMLLESWPVETIFRYVYPRLDVAVSRMQNHLLKSPFCVHPKTGRVCVPISVDKIEEFDPEGVPTLQELLDELDDAYKETGEDGKKTVEFEWQKTRLNAPLEAFRKDFLNVMWKDLIEEEIQL